MAAAAVVRVKVESPWPLPAAIKRKWASAWESARQAGSTEEIAARLEAASARREVRLAAAICAGGCWAGVGRHVGLCGRRLGRALRHVGGGGCALAIIAAPVGGPWERPAQPSAPQSLAIDPQMLRKARGASGARPRPGPGAGEAAEDEAATARRLEVRDPGAPGAWCRGGEGPAGGPARCSGVAHLSWAQLARNGSNAAPHTAAALTVSLPPALMSTPQERLAAAETKRQEILEGVRARAAERLERASKV